MTHPISQDTQGSDDLPNFHTLLSSTDGGKGGEGGEGGERGLERLKIAIFLLKHVITIP